MKLGALAFLLVGFCPVGHIQAAAPEWLDDPANSQWITFGGPSGIGETNGVFVREGGSEGTVQAASAGGVECAQSVRPDGALGYFYLLAEPWEPFRAWLGENRDVMLTVRYFDGGAGALHVAYDSSDPRVKLDPYPAGVWRRPDEFPKGLTLAGTRTWKSWRVRLPLAFFTKRVHGADLRIEANAADFALAGVALTRIPKGQDPPLAVKQELRVARTAGMVSFGRGARFEGTFAQQGDAPLVLEAELATQLTLKPGQTPGLDARASGGAYLHHVESAEYRFTVQTPGQYAMWQRAFFPWGGNWNHEEQLDGQPARINVDHNGPGTNEWLWVRTGTYDLGAGEHTFRLAYLGGARLDVIVLSRQDQPPDLAGLRSSYYGERAGEVWTVPVQPLDVARWRSVQFELSESAQARIEVSTDGGKTWTAFDPASDLSTLPVSGAGRDRLQFHVVLRGGEDASPALFGGGLVTYLAGPNNRRAAENARWRIEMDAFGVASIRDHQSGALVSAAAPVHDSLALLTLKKPGPAATQSVDLYSSVLEKAEVSGSESAPVLTLVHRLDNGMRLTTTAKMLPSGESEWQLEIDNPTDLEVAELRFPVVTGLQLGGDPADDWIFMPKCWGQVWKNPAAQTPLRSTGEATAMRWGALWDERQGFYLGIEDPRFEDHTFFYGGDSSGGATLAAAQRILVQPHSQWKSAIYRLAVTGGDWHEGADLYRRYAAQVLRPTDVPPHVKWLVDAWQTQPSNSAPYRGWDMIEPGGEMLMAANRQMLDGADSGYCGLYPYPALTWGSVREFSQKLAVRRAFGGLYTPYHNFHLWSPGYGHYPRIGSFPKSRLPDDAPKPDDDWYRRAATYAYDGTYSRMETDPFAQLGMAMGSREWRDWLADWTRRYLDWGADGMYYDQFNMMYGNGRLYPDFGTYGCWMPATVEVISRIRQAARARNPYYTASGEVCNDVYGQHLDLHMTSGVFNRLEFFRYCVPQQLLIDGGWNGGLNPVFGTNRVAFIWQVGARFEGAPADGRILALRRAVKSLLYDAQFMDTVGLTVRDASGKHLAPEYSYSHAQNAPTRGTIGRWFLYAKDQQRGAVVNVINSPVQRGATITLDTKPFGPVNAAFAWTLEGECIPVRGAQQGDSYRFPVPESELSSIVLAHRLAPVAEWRLDPAAAPGVTRKLSLKLTNVGAESEGGSVALRLPKGWKALPVIQFGPIASGRSQSFIVPVPVPANARKGRCDVWCDIATPSGRFSAYSLLVVNDPVVVDLRGNPGSYHVWLKNLTTEPFTGSVSCQGRDGLETKCRAEFALPPEAEIAVPVEVRGQDRLREISEIEARVKVARQAVRVVRAVMPVVPNGDFETDRAGDRKPDWWMSRKLGDEWSYERLHLAEGAHGGRSCLRLDPPQPGEKFIRAYPVNGAFRPGARYRASVWIKGDAQEGAYANVAGQVLGAGQTGPEWKQFTREFTQAEAASAYIGLHNESPTPAYFDDLVIEEIQETEDHEQTIP